MEVMDHFLQQTSKMLSVQKIFISSSHETVISYQSDKTVINMCFCAVKTAQNISVNRFDYDMSEKKATIKPQSFKVLVLFNKIQPKELQFTTIENKKEADVCWMT